MVKIVSRPNHSSGIPLGGLGTGSIEIRPDGGFYEWQIFNTGKWASSKAEGCQALSHNAIGAEALPFYIRTRQEGQETKVRRLGLSIMSDEFRYLMYSWMKTVQEIQFEGRFPIAGLEYIDQDLPVSVQATMFSPFIPHDERVSGTPGFYAVFKIKNQSASPVEVALLGKLKNSICSKSENRMLENLISKSGGTTRLTMKSRDEAAPQPDNGSLCLSVTGGDTSWICGDYSSYFNNYVSYSPFGISEESYLWSFYRNGRLPDTGATHSASDKLCMTEEEIDLLSLYEIDSLLDELKKYASVVSIWNRISDVEPCLLESREGKIKFLKTIRNTIDVFDGKDRKGQTWGDGALCSSSILMPQEEKEVCFVLSWYFPNHYSPKGNKLEHMYQNWFKDAEEVNAYMTSSFEMFRQKTLSFANALYNTNLEMVLPESWSAQLATLTKSSWWLKNGDFAVWEGLGSCGLHTMDITYQGSFSILALFPELQKRQMEMGARFQREDGRVHHLFTPDLSTIDNDFDRVDMNPQFVLLVCRDFLWTGDREYIKRMWPSVNKAIESILRLDLDGDGLPDTDTHANTYDAWSFSGTPSYISSLWLLALLAGVRLAKELNESSIASKWAELAEKGKVSFERRLWNGEYYSLWVDGERRDECCMSDQIDGEWFARLVGLDAALPDHRLYNTLKAILRYNFTRESGLINASYPAGTTPTLFTYRNCQAEMNWTGIEYAIASMYMENGLYGEGLEIVKNIDERYRRAGRIWNHQECGDHYYRAMSSWALLLAATGFKIDVPAQKVRFASAHTEEEVYGPWVSSFGWGSYKTSPECLTVHCSSGNLRFKRLETILKGEAFEAFLNGSKVVACIQQEQNSLSFIFESPLHLQEGDTLVISRIQIEKKLL